MVKGISKEDKRDFIRKVESVLRKNPDSFFRLQDYNAAKRFVRDRDPRYCGRLVDNGQHFLNIMQQVLKSLNDPRLNEKFRQLQAQHRAKKALAAASNTIKLPEATVMVAVTTTSSGEQSDDINGPETSFPAPKQESNPETASKVNSDRIDVFYGRTDNTPGDKEYSCVVVQTSESNIKYYGDVYEPYEGCRYKILYEIPMTQLRTLRLPDDERLNTGWVFSPTKERVLQYWKDHS
jgi:hypothetical protein